MLGNKCRGFKFTVSKLRILVDLPPPTDTFSSISSAFSSTSSIYQDSAAATIFMVDTKIRITIKKVATGRIGGFHL